jgi:hypothetical protein
LAVRLVIGREHFINRAKSCDVSISKPEGVRALTSEQILVVACQHECSRSGEKRFDPRLRLSQEGQVSGSDSFI